MVKRDRVLYKEGVLCKKDGLTGSLGVVAHNAFLATLALFQTSELLGFSLKPMKPLNLPTPDTGCFLYSKWNLEKSRWSQQSPCDGKAPQAETVLSYVYPSLGAIFYLDALALLMALRQRVKTLIGRCIARVID